ncbi:unnamed protein product [Vitrella brassicaformis CCMP3155]|uniref:Uncharacterized protein n=1 Tax=Vitrella brassicaformis (strain CCMP3155) TaxID=1169540 RepID=A0A0G4F6L2_VITBC|nr:unnamed protein product [Vitrella brassicaformis CCMP3155]|eukprot:CEM07757.1 unnamed protein product [Vitrella brassicaformis CCMP3155]
MGFATYLGLFLQWHSSAGSAKQAEETKRWRERLYLEDMKAKDKKAELYLTYAVAAGGGLLRSIELLKASANALRQLAAAQEQLCIKDEKIARLKEQVAKLESAGPRPSSQVERSAHRPTASGWIDDIYAVSKRSYHLSKANGHKGPQDCWLEAERIEYDCPCRIVTPDT